MVELLIKAGVRVRYWNFSKHSCHLIVVRSFCFRSEPQCALSEPKSKPDCGNSDRFSIAIDTSVYVNNNNNGYNNSYRPETCFLKTLSYKPFVRNKWITRIDRWRMFAGERAPTLYCEHIICVCACCNDV